MAGPETVTASGPVLLHLLYLIFQHTLDLVAHGLRAGLTEMNPHDIGGAAYLLHQCGLRGCSLITMDYHLILLTSRT